MLLQDGTFLQFRLSQKCCGACDTVLLGDALKVVRCLEVDMSGLTNVITHPHISEDSNPQDNFVLRVDERAGKSMDPPSAHILYKL